MGFAYMFLLNKNIFVLGTFITLVILGGIAMGMYTLYWFTHTPRLLGHQRVQVISTIPSVLRQTFALWFSFTWRSMLLMLPLVFVAEMLMRLTTHQIAQSTGFDAQSTLTFAILWMMLNYLLIPFVVAAFVWRWLLKKRTFRWGQLELTRLKD
jgi:hypothetical protein